MKKVYLAFMFITSFSMFSQTISENALGLRLGSNDGFGYELSYQRALGSNNRLELDLGFRNANNIDAFKLVGLYQWVWNIDGGFNWYAGAGGGVASWSSKFNNNKSSGTYFLGAGNVGIEYNFDIPLLISIDYRPELYFGGNGGFGNSFGSDIALSLRYQF